MPNELLLFQNPPNPPQKSKIPKKVTEYCGPEQRGMDRIPLSPENQALVTVLKRTLKSGCGDNCIIPKEAHEHIPRVVGIIKDIGDNSIGRGLDNVQDHYNNVQESIDTVKYMKKIALMVMITVVISGAISAIWYALQHKVQGG